MKAKMTYSRRVAVFTGLLGAIGASLQAAPWDRVSDTAHDAVEGYVKARIDRYAKVTITSTNRAPASSFDTRVSGEGYYTLRSGPKRFDFFYSVKVNNSNLDTSGLEVNVKGIPGEGGSDNPDRPTNSRVPDWAVGKFYGRADLTDADVEAKIDRDGKAEVSIKQYGSTNKLRGNYRDGRLEMSSATFDLSKSGNNGIKLTNRNNRRDTMTLKDEKPNDRDEVRLSVITPRRNERIRSGRIEFQGEGSGAKEMQLTVTRKNRSQVLQVNLGINDQGIWRTNRSLGGGDYTLQARILQGRSIVKEVKWDFRVED